MQVILIVQLLLLIVAVSAAMPLLKKEQDGEMPAPFYRNIYLTEPQMTGNDVTIARMLLSRDESVLAQNAAFSIAAVFDEDSDAATRAFQTANALTVDGVIGAKTAELLLDLHTADGYTDSGFTAASMGYKYKVHVPVHKNHSIETDATLYDAYNKVLLKFRTRQHGKREDGTDSAWPDYGNGDYGLTELASNGNTVTGLVELDLNSPEPDPQVYGPWPVNRVVRGLEGNALTMLPNIRDGILIHTGNWTTAEHTWDPREDMPNSSGCIHAHPADVQQIYQLLLDIGVEVRDNTFSGKNYPYQPQGIAVIELMD